MLQPGQSCAAADSASARSSPPRPRTGPWGRTRHRASGTPSPSAGRRLRWRPPWDAKDELERERPCCPAAAGPQG
eukprot:6841166-Alexandrium_andersonii.AAC.1